MVLSPIWGFGFSFAPGHLYSSNWFASDIWEYDSSGAVIDTLDLSVHGSDLRGIEFHGERLFVVSSLMNSLEVLSVNGAGDRLESYGLASGRASGNISLGKITFGSGNQFYVGTFDGLARFSTGDPGSGELIWTQSEVFDVACLPSGNLLIVSSYSLYEITSAGALVREITTPGVHFVDIRGLEYEPSTSSIYLSMLGHSGTPFTMFRIDAATGELEKQTTFTYGDDMFLASDGSLLVGSRTQSPAFFNRNLDYLGSFSGDSRLFVTQMPVPEPATLFLLAAGVAGLGYARRRGIDHEEFLDERGPQAHRRRGRLRGKAGAPKEK